MKKMYTLITGNCSLVTAEFLDQAFPGDNIVLLGKLPLRKIKSKHVTCYSEAESGEKIRSLAASYRFDRILYFSERIVSLAAKNESLFALDHLLSAVSRTGNPRILLLTPLNSAENTEADGRQIISDTIPKLCRWYADTMHLDIKELRLPNLYTLNGINPELDWFFERCLYKEPVTFSWNGADTLGTVSVEDIAPLLNSIFEHWETGYEVLGNANFFPCTCDELKAKAEALLEGCSIRFAGDWSLPALPPDNGMLKRKYNWYPKGSMLQDLPALLENYRQRVGKAKVSPIARTVKAITNQRQLLRWIELFLFWIVFEWLGRLAGNTVRFEQIDLRLAFVVLMGCTYGLNQGAIAAVLACVSLVAASISAGTAWMSLVYDPSKWIPFIVYLTAGAACGYLNLHSAEMVKELTRDKEVLQEKNRFLRQLYAAQTENKDLLKQQVLGTQDSFGKIYNLTQKLDDLEPQMVLENAVSVLEELLGNTSVSLYTTSTHNDFARLEAASASISERLPQSIDLRKIPQITEAVRSGRVWINTSLTEGLPMYAAGVYRDGNPIVLVLLHSATELQQGLYYRNLLSITCGLIQSSMLRAIAFSEATRSVRYYPGSVLLKPEWMGKRIEICKQMQQQRHARFSLLEIDLRGAVPADAADGIAGLLRKSDVLGMTENGTMLLLLPQTPEKSLPVVTERLRRAGYQASPVHIAEEVIL